MRSLRHAPGIRLGAAAAAAALVVGLPGAPASGAKPPSIVDYTIVDMGTLGGSSSEASQVNMFSVAVGTSTTAAGETHAFRWDRRVGMTDLGPYWTVGGGGVGPYSFAPPPGINILGQVSLNIPLPGGLVRAARWDPRSGVQELGTLGGERSVASDINNLGEIAGWSQTATGATHAFIWSKARGMRDLGTLSGGESGPANDPCGYCYEVSARGDVSLNDRGQVAGTSDGRAFRWDRHSGMVDLGILGVDPWGQAFSFASDINEHGVVVGSSSHPGGDPSEDFGPRAFRAAPGAAMVDLGTVGWFSHASAVNERGQIVGNSTLFTEYAYAGVVWDRSLGLRTVATGAGGSTTDINNWGTVVGIVGEESNTGVDCTFVWREDAGKRCLPQLPGGGGLREPTDINDRGQIVGSGLTPLGTTHAVLWEPVLG